MGRQLILFIHFCFTIFCVLQPSWSIAQKKYNDLWSMPIPDRFQDTLQPNLDSTTNLILKRGYYKVADLPLEKLRNLESLYLIQCKVDNLKLLLKKIEVLPKLQYLDIAGNFIDTLQFNKSSFPSLRYLSVERCGVRFVDSSIAELKLLEYLNLGMQTGDFQVSNRIQILPNSFKNLLNLKTLVYANNEIDKLPSILFDLNNLEYLNISGNSISVLPENMGQYFSLKVIDISYNKFYYFPNSILKMENLRTLNMKGNSIVNIPAALFQKNYFNKLEIGLKNTVLIE